MIALLRVLYKLFAALTTKRLLQIFDPWVQASQFGFRPKKSASLPFASQFHSFWNIHHIDSWTFQNEWEPTKTTPGIEKASSSTTHAKSHLTHFWKTTVSCIRWTHGSDYLVQRSGIWQGCPIYLRHISTRQNNKNQFQASNILQYSTPMTRGFLATALTLTISNLLLKE